MKKSEYEKKANALLKSIKAVEKDLIKRYGATSNEEAFNDPEHEKYYDLIFQYKRISEAPERFETLYWEMFPPEVNEEFNLLREKNRFYYDVTLNEAFIRAKKKFGKKIEVNLSIEDYKTILDALMISKNYQKHMAQERAMLMNFVNRIDKAEKWIFKERGKGKDDYLKALRKAGVEMGWDRGGQGKRDRLMPRQRTELFQEYSLIDNHFDSREIKVEEVKKLTNKFGFASPNECSKYLRKLGFQNVPAFDHISRHEK